MTIAHNNNGDSALLTLAELADIFRIRRDVAARWANSGRFQRLGVRFLPRQKNESWLALRSSVDRVLRDGDETHR